MLFTGTMLASCGNNPNTTQTSETKTTSDTALEAPGNIKEDAVTYADGATQLKSFVYINENKQGKRPIVLVLPEWWGLNDYPKMRAKQLAELGYLSMAVDMYGDGKIADNPKDAQSMAMPFYQNPQMAKARPPSNTAAN